jgi:cell division protein FtsB
MSKVEKLEKEIEKLEMLIKRAKQENALLKDEVDSLWAMMDEMTKSDIYLILFYMLRARTFCVLIK